MPELVQTHRALTRLAGGGDRAARFLSGWCPPAYPGGCSLAALSEGGRVRPVRNYDLSPDLNEVLLLRSVWAGRPVMGMVEFPWGLSDGLNDAGLSITLAFGGCSTVERGFGNTPSSVISWRPATTAPTPNAAVELPIAPACMPDQSE